MDALKKLAEETARKRKALSERGFKVLYLWVASQYNTG
jgi:hypothetical protein